LKNPSQKRAGGVAQDEGPEFKSQYRKKKKKRERENERKKERKRNVRQHGGCQRLGTEESVIIKGNVKAPIRLGLSSILIQLVIHKPHR
jgi:hypothetical protein